MPEVFPEMKQVAYKIQKGIAIFQDWDLMYLDRVSERLLKLGSSYEG